ACLTNKTVEAGINWNFDLPVPPFDAGAGTNVTLVLVSTVTNRSGFCFGSFVATRTWSATDACGNSNTCSQIITVVDTTPPPLACPTNKTVEAGTDWNFDVPDTPTDAGAGTNVTLVLVSTVTNRSGFCAGSFI